MHAPTIATERRAALPTDPEAELLPGVRWGRPDWVLSAAFWSSMLALATERDGFVSSDGDLAQEVGFCLLGGYGITAEVNRAVHDVLVGKGMFEAGRRPSAAEIEAQLRLPVTVGTRSVRYRFPHQRAGRLAYALSYLEDHPAPCGDDLALRRYLLAIPGIGPKTASWIVRNLLGSDNVAILDIHVIRAGLRIGLFPEPVRLPRDYEAMERRFLDFCDALGARASLVDAVMWRCMRNMGGAHI
ncbi:hypothetical protein ASG51_14550 [Methylobacterium sp. Leaf465]|uniref:8-oxoguanine DNA glycosylase n=1 Tax=Methylobacterium sp. Leaf465 TaxID=1736385 RepID=UPI0006F70E27|nr:hypothetical protein [Methylobacterium sp. Leaf465]KQT70263.1 hypothetical protein ASG51_14550 [Methylobacterium sp. Leaf465]